MQSATLGTGKLGTCRLGMRRYDWEDLRRTFETISSCDVTRRMLKLTSTRDATTGWFTKEYTESTVEGLLATRAAARSALPLGSYVRYDAVFCCAEGFLEGDELETENNVYYEVKTVKNHYIGDSFFYRECDLTELPMHGLTYLQTTPSVEDARYRTRDYWESYIENGNLNNHNWMVCYSDPDQPLIRVFKDKAIDIIFTVDQPNSTPDLGHDQVTRGYDEHVPTHILTLDTRLQWLAAAELRRVVEDNPEGSQRSLERSGTEDRWLGSHRLYDRVWTLNYWRDTT